MPDLTPEMIRELQEKAARFNPEMEPIRDPNRPIPEPDTMKRRPWQETLSYILVDVWDSIKRARQMIESREPTYKRIAKKALKLTEALVYIAGYFASRKFKLFDGIARLLKQIPK